MPASYLSIEQQRSHLMDGRVQIGRFDRHGFPGQLRGVGLGPALARICLFSIFNFSGQLIQVDVRLGIAAELDDLVGPRLGQIRGKLHAHVAQRLQVLALG